MQWQGARRQAVRGRYRQFTKAALPHSVQEFLIAKIQLSQAALDGNLPGADGADMNQRSRVGDRRFDILRQARRLADPPKEHKGI